jgi:hypothetical protein
MRRSSPADRRSHTLHRAVADVTNREDLAGRTPAAWEDAGAASAWARVRLAAGRSGDHEPPTGHAGCRPAAKRHTWPGGRRPAPQSRPRPPRTPGGPSSPWTQWRPRRRTRRRRSACRVRGAEPAVGHAGGDDDGPATNPAPTRDRYDAMRPVGSSLQPPRPCSGPPDHRNVADLRRSILPAGRSQLLARGRLPAGPALNLVVNSRRARRCLDCPSCLPSGHPPPGEVSCP